VSATSILINVGAQTADAVRGLSRVNKALGEQQTASEKTAGAFKKMMPVALAAGGALAAAGTLAVKSASDQQQAFGALDSVFKDQSQAMQDWARDQSAVGLSATQAGTAAALLGSQLKNLGADTATAAAQSQELVGLGADLAATFGGTTADAVDALSAAFKGEFDSLEKYGVSIKAADVSARLAAQGQDKLTGEAKKAAEAAAVNALLWEQTADAQGKAGDEADTTAGSMATLKADLANVTAELGTALLPAVESVLGMFKDFSGWAQENQTLFTVLATAIAAVTVAIIAINVAMAAWTAVTAAWTAVTVAATGVGAAFAAVMAFLTAPVTLIILAIIALIAIVVLLSKNWDTVTKALGKAWQWLKDKAVAIFNAVKTFLAAVWQGIRDKVTAVWNGIKTWLAAVWDGIKTTAAAAFNALKSKLAEIWENIKTTIRGKIAGLIDYVSGLPGKILSAIGNLNSLLYDKGADLIQGLINGIRSMLGGIGNMISGAIPDWVPGFNTAVPAGSSAAAFMAGPTAAPKAVKTPKAEPAVLVTEEQIYRAVSRLLLKGDARNGRLVMVG
jgi:hypothetical protein